MKKKRNFYTYFLLTVVTILCGLLSRSQYVSLPSFISVYAGDTLWALMVFLIFCMIARRKKTWEIALVSILFSFTIEVSQLYQAPWINTIRHTRVGGLILGYGFKWSDLLCYVTGVITGGIIDLGLIQKK